MTSPSHKKESMMGWSVGFDSTWNRDIGYGVPALCDYPGCDEEIHRGLAYVCGGEPYGGKHGCGLFFCEHHQQLARFDGGYYTVCANCKKRRKPFKPKPDLDKWVLWKLTDPSWVDKSKPLDPMHVSLYLALAFDSEFPLPDPLQAQLEAVQVEENP